MLAALLALGAGAARADGERLLFTGDVLLGREVAREIDRRGDASPWAAFGRLFQDAAWVAGNFEGAVGDAAACPPERADRTPCLAVPARLVPLLARAGFRAMSLENNHAGDLGDGGRASASALRAAGVAPLQFDDAPSFVRVGSRLLAVIPLTLVPGRAGRAAAVPSTAVARRLALAAALADWTIVSVHWGAELVDWPTDAQRRAAAWLVAHGASVIVGHHPHVTQAPDCVDGHPVFFSLGNHVFDQKYPLTKRGQIADCRIADDRLACGALATETPARSAFPRPLREPPDGVARLAQCPVPARSRLEIAGTQLGVMVERGHPAAGALVLEGVPADGKRWRARALPVLRLEPARFTGHDYLFALQQHPSTIDGEDGPRPYVYDVGPHGLIARWRGSALAWPLVDATVLALPDQDSALCALHRRDSFIQLDAGSTGTRVAAYRWNGFGFAALEDPTVLARCAETLESATP
jgi:poly-gamma-glutamate synthesis protein (capsule biosynthesis protein)